MDNSFRHSCLMLLSGCCVIENLYSKFDEPKDKAGNTKWGSISVPLTSCLTGLD